MTRWAMLAGVTILVLALALPAGVVRAEASREVAGHRLTLWFETTPVYPEERNAMFVRVQTAEGAPVEGLADGNLRLRIGIPNQVTETLAMEALPGQPGVYRVDILLPRAAPYTMQVLARIGGAAIDETFITGRELDKVIVRDRQYPRGAEWAVIITFGGYLVGLAFLLIRSAIKRRRRTAFGH